MGKAEQDKLVAGHGWRGPWIADPPPGARS